MLRYRSRGEDPRGTKVRSQDIFCNQRSKCGHLSASQRTAGSKGMIQQACVCNRNWQGEDSDRYDPERIRLSHKKEKWRGKNCMSQAKLACDLNYQNGVDTVQCSDGNVSTVNINSSGKGGRGLEEVTYILGDGANFKTCILRGITITLVLIIPGHFPPGFLLQVVAKYQHKRITTPGCSRDQRIFFSSSLRRRDGA